MSDKQTIPSNPDVVVIGAGLAGLSAAAHVARAGKTAVVYEKRGEVGGQARSTTKDGFTFNQGPHALYRGGTAERILTDLGLVLCGGVPPTEGRIVFGGVAEIAPAGPATLLRTKAFGLRDKAEIGRLLGRLPKLKARDYADVTVDQWIADSVTGQRPAEMLRALTRLSSYCHQPDLASADMAIGQLQSVLEHGVLYLDGGWQTLVDQLRGLAGVHVVTAEPLDELPDAPAVIVATGSPQTSGALLGRTYDVGPAAAASCLDLGLSRRPDHDVVIGGDTPFYFSNHSAVADLAPDGQYHASVLQYLADGQTPDADGLAAFARYGGVRDDAVVVSRKLHRMVTVTSLPTADRGGMAGRPAVTDSGHSNVFIAGDWVGPDGHLVDASLASAKAAAELAVATVDQRLRVA